MTNKYLIKLAEINETITKIYNAENYNIGVLGGLSGLAIFQFHYAKLINKDTPSKIGVDILELCINKINNTHYRLSTYCNGICGFGWALNYLYKNNFVDVPLEQTLLQIDTYLYEMMLKRIEVNDYDFLHGTLGYGFYFVERYENTKVNFLKEQFCECINEIIGFLQKLSEKHTSNSLKWISTVDLETNQKGYDLGLAHGIPSIISFLAKVYKYSEFKNKVEKLLIEGVNYLLSFKNDENDSISLFPRLVMQEKKVDKMFNSRLAWCYGDLGIALSLWNAGKVLQDKNLKNIAIEVFKHSSKRKAKGDNLVKDAYICHGSFGIAHIFNYMYIETKINDFKIAGKYWMNDGLYKMESNDNKCWNQNLDILNGIAGIGLVITSYLSIERLDWEKCLMISI